MGNKSKRFTAGTPAPKAPDALDEALELDGTEAAPETELEDTEQEVLETDVPSEDAPEEIPDEQSAPEDAAPVAPAPKAPKASAALDKDALVVDHQGKPLYKRKAPTLTEAGRKPAKAPAKTSRNKMKPHSKDGTHINSRYLKFPADRWGLTKDLKEALIMLGSRIAGNPEKMALVKETLRIGLSHVDMKYKRDGAIRQKQQADAEALTNKAE